MHDPTPFVLWGSAGHAKVLADVIAGRGGAVLALFDNSPAAEASLGGVPLFQGMDGLEQWLAAHSADGVAAAVAIGGARGEDRCQLAERFLARGFSLPPLVHATAAVSPAATLGAGCQVLAGTVVAAGAVLGSACIVNNRASVDHECVLGQGVHVAPGATLCGCIRVGDYTMIGAGAVVLPRVTIGCHAIVGAGAVVTKDVPDFHVVAGNPARTLRRTR